MKNVLIVGATGMVGGLVLKNCINDKNIGRIISISRKPTGVTNEKLTEVIHNDYLDYSQVQEAFVGIDVAYYCIGVYTGSVPDDLFTTITIDYTKVFADMLQHKSPEATFCFLSGAGADRQEKSRMIFARDKGTAENYLVNKGFKALHIFRPGYIYPVTPRKEPNFSYILFRKLYPLLKYLMPNSVVTSEELANTIFETGLYGGSLEIYENKDILRLQSKEK